MPRTSPKVFSVGRFPDEVIQLDRGRLRRLELRDLADIRAARNDDAIRAWLPLPIPYTDDDARSFVVDHAPRHQQRGDGIERAVESDGRLCGVVGLRATDWTIGKTEAGYWMAPWGRGRGLMTTALRALTDFAFDHGMQRVEVQVATGNLASLGVALRAGFRIEGTLRRARRTHDGLVDVLVLSRLDDDPFT